MKSNLLTSKKWTVRDQVTAEVAAACGVKYAAIGRVLGCQAQTVKRHLIVAAAERKREIARNYYQSRPDVQRNATLRWLEANPGLKKEYNRQYYEFSRRKHFQEMLERQRALRQKKKPKKEQQDQANNQ
jgi:protein-disulfide isomerase-like protein with CxxC motif